MPLVPCTNRLTTTSRESGSPDSREVTSSRKPLILVVEDHECARSALTAIDAEMPALGTA
jgi:hypothetical protein